MIVAVSVGEHGLHLVGLERRSVADAREPGGGPVKDG